jgi:hypothetical protein
MLRASAAIVIALAACGGSKAIEPDAAGICAGTVKPKGAIVLRTGEPNAGGKARGLRELASRSAQANSVPLAELDRFAFATDAVAIFTAHVEERERKVREDLELARAIVIAMQSATPPVTSLDEIERFPPSPAGATSIAPSAAELLKPLDDGSAVRAVTERATALARALEDLVRKLEGPESTEAIKIANVAHGKLNEVIGALHSSSVTLASLAEEQGGRAFAENERLWARLVSITARLADPWPQSVLTARSRAFVIAGPRQWVVTCSAPLPFVVPPAILAAVPVLTSARDALTISLGHQPAPTTPVAPPTLDALHAALDAAVTR